MSINLLEEVQKNLGYPALQKIDPNTQQSEEGADIAPGNKFSQAAIPAVLTGLYRFAQDDEGAAALLQVSNSSNWVGKIFNDNKKEAIETISDYSKETGIDPVAKMNEIANEAIKILKENLPPEPGIKDVKIFFNHQKNNILQYLPANLNMGELLYDNTLDDNTNKMEGPISSLIQSIGAAFSSPVTGEEIKRQEEL